MSLYFLPRQHSGGTATAGQQICCNNWLVRTPNACCSADLPNSSLCVTQGQHLNIASLEPSYPPGMIITFFYVIGDAKILL